jgi:hypothetical protein
MARRPFQTAEALIVVSTDGYFDVFPTTRLANARPAYRGVVAELSPALRGLDEKLSVRPDSVALQAAVATWSRSHGDAAVRGEMGLGRQDATA